MPEVSAQHVPSVAQATMPGACRPERDMAEGSPRVVVLGERFVSASLAPSITGGGVSVGMPRREGSVELGVGEESSLTLTSMGSGLPAWGEPLL
jgi:hypothetical protein